MSDEICRGISQLSDEARDVLAQVSAPLVVLVAPDRDANTSILELSGPLAARWGAIAAAVAAYSRNGIHYRGQAMRLTLGSRCECEWRMSEQDLAAVLGNEFAGVNGLRSRYRDSEWQALLKGASEGGEAGVSARNYASQVLMGSRGCPGCPRGQRPRG